MITITGEILNAITIVGAGVAFFVGLFQYRKAQRWKKSEWVAQEMQSFFGDHTVNCALKMLDWGNRSIELYPHRESEKDRFVFVDDHFLADALSWHKKHGPFTDVQIILRDVFDHFLDRLERINSFVETKLISIDDLRPYLVYFAENIMFAAENDPEVNRLVKLRKYIEYYRFNGVDSLFKKLCKCNSQIKFICLSEDSTYKIMSFDGGLKGVHM